MAQARARIWPRLTCFFQVRSTAVGVVCTSAGTLKATRRASGREYTAQVVGNILPKWSGIYDSSLQVVGNIRLQPAIGREYTTQVVRTISTKGAGTINEGDKHASSGEGSLVGYGKLGRTLWARELTIYT